MDVQTNRHIQDGVVEHGVTIKNHQNIQIIHSPGTNGCFPMVVKNPYVPNGHGKTTMAISD